MGQFYKPVILVTGCGSGIGLTLARILWKLPEFRVVITAREKSMAPLHEMFDETDRFWIRKLDVTAPAERNDLFDEISSKWNGVDILINNAGISYRGAIEHMDDQSEMNQMNTNYFGPMALIRLALPYMRKKGRGKVINVSSVSGMLAMPTMGSYSASKFALEGASESLWYEMRPLGIDVVLVQPGFIHSNSFKNVYRPPAATICDVKKEEPYCDYYTNMEPFIEKMMSWSPVTPEKIADVIMKVIHKKKPSLRAPATIDAMAFHLLRRFLPRRLFHFILFYFLPGSGHWAKGYTKSRDAK